MRRAGSMAIGLFAVFLATGCSTVSVSSDWDREADFSGFESFAWFERAQRPDRPPRGQQANPIVERRVVRELTSQLKAKGFAETTIRGADFLITYHTNVRQQVEVVHTGYGHWRWRHGTSRRYTYPVGTLIVDVIDSGRRQLVWRGIASGSFGSTPPSDEKISKVVARILADFPPL